MTINKLGILRTTHNNISYENPFLLASGPPTATGEMIRRGFRAGWAGAVTKTITPDDLLIKDVSPRFAALKSEHQELIGFENIELLSKKPLAYWLKELKEIKKEFPEKIIIASIMGQSNIASWINVALAVQGAGVDAVELNFSCPHGMPEKHVGAAIGQDAQLVQEMTTAIKAKLSIPVIVKLTPNVTDIVSIAQAAQRGGADALAAINTVQCLMGIDLDTFRPLPSVGGYSTYGGYSGRGVKPIGLKCVAQIASQVNLPIHGIGGIASYRDALEYILVGACVVQICTEVMIHGYNIIRPLLHGLAQYLEEKNCPAIAEMRARALTGCVTHEMLAKKIKVRPKLINEAACKACGRCVTACRDGGYQAITLTDQRLTIDYQRCDGCSLCCHVCPENALVACDNCA